VGGAARAGHYPRRVDPPTPILLVTGPPASGKTFVAGLVADRLRLPLIAKDDIKETLFESLGTGDVAWSQQLGRATRELIFWALEAHLRARRPVLVESNFAAEDARPRFRALAGRHPFAPLEIHCTADEDVLLARYAARIGSRHPGHLDEQRMPEIAEAIGSGRHGPVRAGGQLLVVDTTAFEDVDADALLRAARAHVGADGVP
jgi:predicted kinase